jgi:hypothetical protein
MAGKASAKSETDVEQERVSALGQTHGAADAPGPGSDEVQAAMDVATEQGFFGVEVDGTPNEHYTVAGVTAGKPTPETDADAHDAVNPAAARNPHRR